MASVNTPTFQAGGLASGLDTTSIVDSLVALESRPLDLLRGQQAGLRTQISSIGDLTARLASLKEAADGLGTGGALGVKVTSTNTAFSTTATSASNAGSFAIAVGSLATAALARSAAFTSATAPVMGGSLHMIVQGTAYDITIGDGAALADVALAIRQSGAPVSAVVLNNGTSSYLSISNRNTGFPLTGVEADALSITETSTGVLGKALGASIITPAKNAAFTIDGLAFNSTSNTVSDAIPGTTLLLKGITAPATTETLTMDNDVEASATNLQKFVDAFNRVMSLVQTQMAVAPGTDRSASLSGDAAVRGLQQQLSSLVVNQVGTGAVRTLADLGIRTQRDGSLLLNKTTLATAMSRDASAVNGVFATATTGLSAKVSALFDGQTNSATGRLTLDTKGKTDSISAMDRRLVVMQTRVDSFRNLLIMQFTAMEKSVAGLKATGTFLNNSAFGLAK